MNRAKFRFKDYVSVSLPLPELPKRARELPSRANFDFMSRLTRDTQGLAVYLTARGTIAITRRTSQLVPVRFNRYIRWDNIIEIQLPNGTLPWVRPTQLYFIHEEEARNVA